MTFLVQMVNDLSSSSRNNIDKMFKDELPSANLLEKPLKCLLSNKETDPSHITSWPIFTGIKPVSTSKVILVCLSWGGSDKDELQKSLATRGRFAGSPKSSLNFIDQQMLFSLVKYLGNDYS